MKEARIDIRAPEAQPNPDWEAIEFPASFGEGQSFVSGDSEGNRLRVAYFRRAVDGRLFAKVWFGWAAEGPPGHAHGGSMAAVLDEAMGATAWMSGYPVLAASIQVDFKAKLPLGTDATVESWIDSTDGRKVFTKARLYDSTTSAVFATGSGVFVCIDPEKMGASENLSALAEANGISLQETRDKSV